jgi:tripartite-type tricarboxylate transporter receptor subunit TctC
MTAGVKMRHIAYKGSPQAVSDVLGGQVDIMIDNTATILPYLKQGRLRPLAITSLSRMPQLPDVPTVAETGLAGFEGVAWAGLALPPGASAATAQALNAAVNKAMAAPELQNKYREMGMEITVTNNPQDLMTYAAKETVKWAEVIKRAGIEPQAL